MAKHTSIIRHPEFWAFTGRVADDQLGEKDAADHDDRHDQTTHNAFADWLEEQGDPRSLIVKRAVPLDPDRYPSINSVAVDLRDGHQIFRDNGDTSAYKVNVHTGVDLGTHVRPWTHDELGGVDLDRYGNRTEVGPALYWRVHVPRTKRVRPGSDTAHFAAPVSVAELYEFIDRLPANNRSWWEKMARARGWTRPMPMKLARLKAPAGGAIVNRQFQEGGRFLPRALGRIRDVIARKRRARPQKLARDPGQFRRPENYEKIADLGKGRSLFAGANDWESGWTWAGIHDTSDTRGERDPYDHIELRHKKCRGCKGSLNAGGRSSQKKCQHYAKFVVQQWARRHGGKKKLKLSLADASKFVGAISDLGKTAESDREFHSDEATHGALADYFQEHDDPREHLVRHTHPAGIRGAYAEAQKIARARGLHASADHVFPDGTLMGVGLFRGPGGSRWLVGWQPTGQIKVDRTYATHFAPKDFLAWVRGFDPEVREALTGKLHQSLADKGRRGRIKLARPRPVDVTFGRALDEAQVPRGSVTAALTADQLKAVEDFYRLPAKERLSPHVDVHPETGRIKTTNHQVAKFFERVHKRQVKSKPLMRVLGGRGHSDPVKAAHLLLNLGSDTERALEGTGKGWYSDEIKYFDNELSKFLNLSPADLTLAKAITAFTSGGQNPKLNTLTMLRMLRAGDKEGDRFRAIPEANKHALQDWLARNQGLPPVPTQMGPELLAWARDHGNGLNRRDEGRFKAAEARYIKDPGSEHDGKILDYKQTVYDEEADDERSKWIPARPDTGPLWNLYKGSGKVKNLRVPILTEDGQLQPVGWTMRNQQVVDNLRKFHRLLDHFGNDRAKAAHWLLAEHPVDDLERIAGAAVKPGYVDLKETGGRLPGAFIFGPKFGPFMLNLHIPDNPDFGRYLTADMWWARNWHRYFGNLMRVSPKGKEKIVGAPAGNQERRFMWRIAQEAAKRAGLSSVAELQAALWYHEQGLWRLFGADNDSFSYRHGIDEGRKLAAEMKLSRVTVNAKEFAPGLREESRATASSREYNTLAAHDVLADKFAENGDPREEHMRRRFKGDTEDLFARARYQRTADGVRVHQFPDGSLFALYSFPGVGVYPAVAPKARVHILGLDLDPNDNRVPPVYRFFHSDADLTKYLDTFDPEDRPKLTRGPDDKMKLSRADVSTWSKGLHGAGPEEDLPLLDFLDEHDDPRRELVANHFHRSNSIAMAIHKAKLDTGAPNNLSWSDVPIRRHIFPDGTKLHVGRVTGPKGTHVALGWDPAPKEPTPFYLHTMPLSEYENWVSKFPEKEQAFLGKAIR